MPKIFFAILFVFLFAVTEAAAGGMPSAIADKDLGVLLLAHGGGQEWNKAIEEAFRLVPGNFKKEIAFGMADADSIQSAIFRLEKARVKGIVVIPLFLSRHSEMYRQIEYILGLREEPDVLFWLLTEGAAIQAATDRNPIEIHQHAIGPTKRAVFSLPYSVGAPIGYSPLIAEILTARMKELGATAGSKVFLIAHGPVSKNDDKLWREDLYMYTLYMWNKFSDTDISEVYVDTDVVAHTIRDDAPPFIKEAALQRIKIDLQDARARGKKVFAVPFLLGPGGREPELKKIFKNCQCTVAAQTLLPHKNISLWIEQEVARLKKDLESQ